MADREQKHEGNVSGKFYVDIQCIDCDLCRSTAPSNFERQNERGYSYVFKQPSDGDELKACLVALADCPVDAIGSNGENFVIPAKAGIYDLDPRFRGDDMK